MHLVEQRSLLAKSYKAIALDNTHIIAIALTKLLDSSCANTYVLVRRLVVLRNLLIRLRSP
ncbi:hypothetical protein [Nostoc sp.]|uniref:hypothetical protein n=1 Tax=Nostoc sp. TaxID=1180 RepID=UPI002FF503F3